MLGRELSVLAVALLMAACSADGQVKSIPGGMLAGGSGAFAGVPGLGTAGRSVSVSGLAGSGAVSGVAGAFGPQPGFAGGPAATGTGGAPAPIAGTPAPTGAAGKPGPVTPPPAGAAAPPPPPPPPANITEPLVPEVKGECPTFRSGTITFGGLGGIEVVAGTKAAGPTAPMVFYWHGTGSFSGEYATSAAAVAQGVRQEGGVLISFQGTTGGDLLSGTAIFGKGDLDLTDQLFACAVKNYNVDPKRVFATGCSAGGLMSVSMATLRSSYMAAAASNSGGWTAPLQFQNGHIPALMTVHGAPGVDVVIIDFSESSATADKGFKGKGGFVINCNHGGAHCGGGGLAGDIWKFFKAHPFGVTPEPWAAGLPAGFSSQCKIFM